jgi:hypothetical protein
MEPYIKNDAIPDVGFNTAKFTQLLNNYQENGVFKSVLQQKINRCSDEAVRLYYK